MQLRDDPGPLLVTGASGLLGSNLARIAVNDGYRVVAASNRKPLHLEGVQAIQQDLTRPGMAAALIESTRPAWIVHCAAATNLDWCEEHEAETRILNTEVPRQLAKAALRCGSHMVQVSTDGVFEGERGGYRETDPARPLNVYGRSKLAAELAVHQALPDALIVRTSLYGWNFQQKDSLAEWILHGLETGQQVPGFEDVVVNPLFVDDLIQLLLKMMERKFAGLYHVASADACSKLEFAQVVAEEFGFSRSAIKPVTSENVGLRARRPKMPWLCTDKIVAALRCSMPSMREGVVSFRRRRGVFDPSPATEVQPCP